MKAIKFKAVKGGKVRAYYWRGEFGLNAGPDTLGRWFPTGLEAARLEVATGAAYHYEPALEGATPDDASTN